MPGEFCLGHSAVLLRAFSPNWSSASLIRSSSKSELQSLVAGGLPKHASAGDHPALIFLHFKNLHPRWAPEAVYWANILLHSIQHAMQIFEILAVLLSPLVALQVSEVIQRRREKRDRQVHVFRTLMTTRASGLAPEHVQALNMIDIEFHGSDRRSKAVLNAWKAYLDQLGTPQSDSALWQAKREDLFVDLLYEMSRFLDYDFDKTHIRRTSYFPKGYGELELDQLELRKGLLALLRGERSVPIHVGRINPVPEGGAEVSTVAVETQGLASSDA